MKNRIQLTKNLIGILILLLVAVACKKDEENELMPRITVYDDSGFVSADTNMKAGDEIKLKIGMQGGDYNITNFVIEVLSNGTEKVYFDTGMNTSSITWYGSFLKSSAPTEKWTLTATDRNGNSVKAGFTISLDTASNYQDIVCYSSLMLGAQNNQEYGSCFNLLDLGTYFPDEVAEDVILQEGVQMLYYYYGDDKNIIASPGANIEDGVFAVNPADWTIVNTSRYIKTGITVDEFNQASNDSIILANYDEAEAKRKAKKLQADDIYTFRTQTGKLGMFHVTEVVGAEEGTISINIKIQE
jgi:hypothetical protein